MKHGLQSELIPGLILGKYIKVTMLYCSFHQEEGDFPHLSIFPFPFQRSSFPPFKSLTYLQAFLHSFTPSKCFLLFQFLKNQQQQTTMGRHIALALDRTEHSIEAFNWYVHDLRKYDDFVELIHCVEPALVQTVGAYPLCIASFSSFVGVFFLFSSPSR